MRKACYSKKRAEEAQKEGPDTSQLSQSFKLPKGSDRKIDGNWFDHLHRITLASGVAVSARELMARLAPRTLCAENRIQQSCKQLQKCFRIRESYRIVNTRHAATIGWPGSMPQAMDRKAAGRTA